MSDEVQHIEAEQRYELVRSEGTAFTTYERRGNVLIINHTFSPPALRGQGVAARLLRGMLADVRRQGLKVLPHCSFAVDYFARFPEERDVLAEG